LMPAPPYSTPLVLPMTGGPDSPYSPYNTYRNLGLPPGPICSPGLASIQATAYPAESDYFFFLADCTKNDGSHLFAVTQEEHLRNYRMCGGEAP